MSNPKGPFIKIRNEGYTWWVRPRDRERLKKEFIPLLSQGNSLSPSQVIKNSDTRVIYRGNLRHRQEALIVKAFKSPGVRDKVKYCFRSPRSVKELRVSLELRKRGISFPRVVAAGVSRKFGVLREDVVLSREIIRAATLSAWSKKNLIEAPLPVLKRNDFLRSLASFIRAIHESGIWSKDFHQGNILVWEKWWEDPHFYLADLHAIRIKKKLSLQNRVESLTHLNDYRIPITDRLRFLNHYCCAAGPLEMTHRKLAREIASRSSEGWQRLWDKRKTRCLKPGKDLVRIRNDAGEGMIRKEYNPHELIPCAKDMNFQISSASSARGKQKPGIFVEERTYPTEGNSNTVIITSYAMHDFFSFLKSMVQPSPAKKAWIAAHNLLMRGIPTPLHIAFGERKCWGVVRESYLITQKVIDSKSSRSFLTDLNSPHAHPAHKSLRLLFVGKLVWIVQWLHQTGMCLSESLDADDFLVTSNGLRLQVLFNTPDRTLVCRGVGVKEMVKDVSRICVAFSELLTPQEQEHLVSLYARKMGLTGKKENKFSRAVRDCTVALVEQKQAGNGEKNSSGSDRETTHV